MFLAEYHERVHRPSNMTRFLLVALVRFALHRVELIGNVVGGVLSAKTCSSTFAGWDYGLGGGRCFFYKHVVVDGF